MPVGSISVQSVSFLEWHVSYCKELAGMLKRAIPIEILVLIASPS